MNNTPETARLTADVVLFGQDEYGEMCALMIRRGWDPFAGHLALPGGHVDVGEDTAYAASRELAEETGITLSAAALKLVGAYAAPGRDPRGRYVTFAYTAHVTGLPTATAGDDATEAQWVPVDELLEDGADVAFDHARIIRDALLADIEGTPRPGSHAPAVVVANCTAGGNITVSGGNIRL